MAFSKGVAGVINILQLLCGVISILIYVGMMALTIRFFPIRVLTLAGTVDVDFSPGVYHTMQIAQGLVSTVSALLFLGRNTFCVSQKVVVNSRAAHQICFDWRVGIVVSIVLAAAAVVFCIVGFVGAVEEMSRQFGSVCIQQLLEEQRCAGTLEDDIIKAEQAILQRANGAPTCVEQTLKTLIPAAYMGVYAFSGIVAVLSVMGGKDFLKSLDSA